MGTMDRLEPTNRILDEATRDLRMQLDAEAEAGRRARRWGALWKRSAWAMLCVTFGALITTGLIANGWRTEIARIAEERDRALVAARLCLSTLEGAAEVVADAERASAAAETRARRADPGCIVEACYLAECRCLSR